MIANIDAEAALLGALLVEPDLIDGVADIVQPGDFYEPAHGRLFEIVAQQAALGKPTGFIALRGHFEQDAIIAQAGGVPYIARLTANQAGLFASAELAEQVRDLSERRRMQAGLSIAAEACADLDATREEIISHADAALSDHGKDGVAVLSIGDCFDALVDSFGRKQTGVTGGIAPLDEVLGPMKPKQLIIGAGRPGMGKTAMALSYALGAAQQGHGVLFVSLEMSASELVTRAASALSFDGVKGIPYSAIRDDDLTHNQSRRVAEIGSMVRGMPLAIADTAALTMGRLNMLVRRHARRMEARGHKLELVIIDYLQLLHLDTKGRSNYEAVSEISRGLKELAKQNDLAVMALAQLSRAVENRPDKRPQLSDLRDSGQIEQDADAVLFLLRPEYYLRLAEPEKGTADYIGWQGLLEASKGQIEFIVAKRRNGETGSATGKFHGAYQVVEA